MNDSRAKPSAPKAPGTKANPPKANPAGAAAPRARKPAGSGPAPAPRIARTAGAGVQGLSLPLLAPPRLGNRILTIAIVGSIVLHAVVLALKFRPFDLLRTEDLDTPLQVALVNARSTSKPTKADVLAQAHLDGGGNTDADRHAKSPLPVLPKENVAGNLAVATRRVEDLERHTQELLTQMKSVPAVAPEQAKPADAPDQPELPTAAEMMQRTLELIRLEAQIDKDMDAYQKRPKRRFVGARAEEYRFARYVEDWRLKVERIGNLNYPEVARKQKLYGSLQMSVSIRADGSVEKVEVDKSSGHKVLDAAAVKVVEMAGPYAPFPPNIKRDTDILTITRTWSFVNGDSLVSQ